MFNPFMIAVAMFLAILLGFTSNSGWLLLAAVLVVIQIARLFIQP